MIFLNKSDSSFSPKPPFTDRRARNKKKTKEEEFKKEEAENDYGASKISVDHVGQLIGVKEEDDIGTGMASFLKMAKEKCVLDEVEDTRKLALQVSQHVKEAIVANPDSYSILEDRFRFDHDIDRLGHRRLGKFDGSGTSRNFEEFSEKSSYATVVNNLIICLLSKFLRWFFEIIFETFFFSK